MQHVTLRALFATIAAGLLLVPAARAGDKPASKVRLYVEGAYCMGCASVLTDALVQGGIKNPSKIAPNRGRGFVIVLGEMSHEADLAPVAKVVNAALTPHREVVAPGVSVEVYAQLDEKSAEAAKAALAKLRGADAAHSVIDVRRGAIGVRLTGKGKLSVNGIIAALENAGIAARVRTGEEAAEKPAAE